MKKVQIKWPNVERHDRAFVMREVDSVLTVAQAMQYVFRLAGDLPVSSKVEVCHISAIPEDKRPPVGPSTGHGEWIWRWKSIPETPGQVYRFSTPAGAAMEAAFQEARWRAKILSEGGSSKDWDAWYPQPGKDWEKRPEKWKD